MSFHHLPMQSRGPITLPSKDSARKTALSVSIIRTPLRATASKKSREAKMAAGLSKPAASGH